MKISDLIKNKDYDRIEIHTQKTKNNSPFTYFSGVCRSVNGELISLDGDTYDDYLEYFEVLECHEFTNEAEGIKNGITILGKWTR